MPSDPRVGVAKAMFEFFDQDSYANNHSPDENRFTEVCVDGYYDLEELAGEVFKHLGISVITGEKN